MQLAFDSSGLFIHLRAHLIPSMHIHSYRSFYTRRRREKKQYILSHWASAFVILNNKSMNATNLWFVCIRENQILGSCARKRGKGRQRKKNIYRTRCIENDQEKWMTYLKCSSLEWGYAKRTLGDIDNG